MKPTNDDSRIIHDLGELLHLSVEMTGRLLQIESEIKSRLRGMSDKQTEPRGLIESPDEDRYGLPTATPEEWKEDHHIDTWRNEDLNGLLDPRNI